MNIDWTHREIIEWRRLLMSAPKANWLQSITLAKVLKDHLGKYTRLATVVVDQKTVGMFALQEIRIGPFHLVELFRGPVWFSENTPEDWLGQFAQLLAKEYPRSLLRRRRWLPEWSYSDHACAQLKAAGFKPRARNYETMWIDLLLDVEEIRARLDKRWRNALSKGLRSSLDIRIDRSGSSAAAFVDYHSKEQERKKYRGRSPSFLLDEIMAAATFKELLIIWALKDDEPVAGVMVVMHGRCGSYRAGWTTDAGRKLNAHNVMLWDAITMLKQAGYRYFDLGGTVSGRGTIGLTQFKKGMGGEPLKTMGVFG